MIDAYEPHEIGATAVEMFNNVGEAHNLEVDRLCTAVGLPPNRVALASYVALRVMLARLEGRIETILAVESREAVETIIRIMASGGVDRTPPPVASA